MPFTRCSIGRNRLRHARARMTGTRLGSRGLFPRLGRVAGDTAIETRRRGTHEKNGQGRRDVQGTALHAMPKHVEASPHFRPSFRSLSQKSRFRGGQRPLQPPRSRPSPLRARAREGAAGRRRSSTPPPPGVSAKTPACRSSGCRWRRSSTARRRCRFWTRGKRQVRGRRVQALPVLGGVHARGAMTADAVLAVVREALAQDSPAKKPTGFFAAERAAGDRAIHGESRERLLELPGGCDRRDVEGAGPEEETAATSARSRPPRTPESRFTRGSSRPTGPASSGMVAARGVTGHLGAALHLDRRVVDAGLFLQEPLHGLEDLAAPALGRGRDVDARRMQPRREGPEVQVVQRFDARGSRGSGRAACRRRSLPACLRAGCAPTVSAARRRAAG